MSLKIKSNKGSRKEKVERGDIYPVGAAICRGKGREYKSKVKEVGKDKK